MIEIRFMTLVGEFRVATKKYYETMQEAEAAIKEYAEAARFTNVKLIESGDEDGYRWTATTPAGRAGRNIAYADYDYVDDFPSEPATSAPITRRDTPAAMKAVKK